MRVLVVDDDAAVRDAVREALELEGYEVATAAGGGEAEALLAREQMDALVLDVLMPQMSGFELCRRLRAGGDRTPILMLTARDATDDRIRGLDLGADDYLVKPFALGELLARLRALLRRTVPDEQAPLRFADLTLDPASYEVYRGARLVELTRTEFSL